MSRLVISILIVVLGANASSSQSLLEITKQAIMRIETPDGTLGTGFVLSDSALGFFLVTGKHVLQSVKS